MVNSEIKLKKIVQERKQKQLLIPNPDFTLENSTRKIHNFKREQNFK